MPGLLVFEEIPVEAALDITEEQACCVVWSQVCWSSKSYLLKQLWMSLGNRPAVVVWSQVCKPQTCYLVVQELPGRNPTPDQPDTPGQPQQNGWLVAISSMKHSACSIHDIFCFSWNNWLSSLASSEKNSSYCDLTVTVSNTQPHETFQPSVFGFGKKAVVWYWAGWCGSLNNLHAACTQRAETNWLVGSVVGTEDSRAWLAVLKTKRMNGCGSNICDEGCV